MPTPPISLRERNRLETWHAIHDCAAELVIQTTWAETTIEKIAQRAGISTRTFFNYFPSKEAAVLGLAPMSLPPEAVATFRSSNLQLLERTTALVMAVIRSGFPPGVNPGRRLKLMKTVPELHPHQRRIGIEAAELVEPILLSEFERQPQLNSSPHDLAKGLLMITGTVIGFTFTKNPTTLTAKSDEQLSHAIAIFREVMTAPNESH